VSEKPILFSAPMVRALLDGTKAQTRRAVKPQPVAEHGCWMWSKGKNHRFGTMGRPVPPEALALCPYGAPGDRLWVREAWRTHAAFDAIPPRDLTTRSLHYEADGKIQSGKLRPGMFMPRWASRITLEVTGVRVERLQDISEADARAEGINMQPRLAGYSKDAGCKWEPANPIQVFCNLWESLNGQGSWDANPHVWVVEFRRLERAS
jgi:hypothetical protein